MEEEMSTASERNRAGQDALATYEFTLVLSGISEITDELADALYAAGCDDALLGMQDGIVFLDFTRESASLMDAIVTAILAVEDAGVDGLQVAEVRPPHAATIDVVNTLLESRPTFDEHHELLSELRLLIRRG